MNSTAAVMYCKAATASSQIKLTHQLILRDRKFRDVGRYIFGRSRTNDFGYKKLKDRPVDRIEGDQFILV